LVPWRLIGEKVRVVLTGGQVRVSHAGREVAAHQRYTGRFQRRVDPLHFAGSSDSNPKSWSYQSRRRSPLPIPSCCAP
jgi:hypothetical protein